MLVIKPVVFYIYYSLAYACDKTSCILYSLAYACDKASCILYRYSLAYTLVMKPVEFNI